MLRIPHCLDNRLTDGGKVVSPTHWPRSTRHKYYFSASGTHSCYRQSEPQGIMRPEGLGNVKNSPYRVSNPRPFCLCHSALITALPRAPALLAFCTEILTKAIGMGHCCIRRDHCPAIIHNEMRFKNAVKFGKTLLCQDFYISGCL
jgi:hypothetical protein